MTTKDMATKDIATKDTATTDEEFLRRLTLDLLGRVPSLEEAQEFMRLPQKDRRTLWLTRIEKKDLPMRIRDWDEKAMHQAWLAMWSEVVKAPPMSRDGLALPFTALRRTEPVEFPKAPAAPFGELIAAIVVPAWSVVPPV